MGRRGRSTGRVGARGPRAGAALLVAGLLLSACSSTGAPSTSATSAPSTTSAAPATSATTRLGTTSTTTGAPSVTAATTTTDPGPPAAPGDVALAEAATLHEQDFGSPWSRYDGGGVLARDPASCSYQPGGPEAALRTGAARRGVTMRFGTTSSYAGAFAYVFADEAAAKAWLTVIASPAWAACEARAYQRFQDSHNRGFVVRLATRTAPGLGAAGFESYASYAVGDAAGHVVAYTNLGYYRLGRVVIRLGIDIGTMSSAQGKQLVQDATSALTAAYARVRAHTP
ncbi:MAG: hypothetical protein JWN46_2180 [Acidimicrobiales bacterium]|nr:hypothetical protein [Acidimicrobiales bacterium]